MTSKESAIPACQLLNGIDDCAVAAGVLAGEIAGAKVLFPVALVGGMLAVAVVPLPDKLAGGVAPAAALDATVLFDDVPLDILPS